MFNVSKIKIYFIYTPTIHDNNNGSQLTSGKCIGFLSHTTLFVTRTECTNL